MFVYLFPVPDGLRLPNVTVLNSTAVHVTWEEPALPNGIILGYELRQRAVGGETVVFRGIHFTLTVTDLSPFTVYEYRVNARTIAGSGFSPWAQVQTFEDSKLRVFRASFSKTVALETGDENRTCDRTTKKIVEKKSLATRNFYFWKPRTIF